MNPLFHTDFSISDSLKNVRKSVLIYETIIYRVGFDTCFTPALLRWSNTVPTVSIDACEAATFSMYIDSRMNCYPCSFGIWNKEISESMKDKTLREIWRGKTFSAFREKSKEKCFNCKQKSLCQNGCRLGMNIELC